MDHQNEVPEGCTPADARVLREANHGLAIELSQARALCERLKLEAQIHAQESRTLNSIIAEIYQAVSGGTGEPGNWHGAKPVADALQQAREERTALLVNEQNLREELAALRAEHDLLRFSAKPPPFV